LRDEVSRRRSVSAARPQIVPVSVSITAPCMRVGGADRLDSGLTQMHIDNVVKQAGNFLESALTQLGHRKASQTSPSPVSGAAVPRFPVPILPQ
jgi:hypothetical protein